MISKHNPELLYKLLLNYKTSISNEYARRLPIYETFKWWARRYSAIFRGIIEYIKEIGAQTLLDPFMGGGTIVLEAARQDMLPIGIELNPYPKYQISTMFDTSIPDILQAGDFLVKIHARLWPKIWAAKYNNKTYEIIHTIFLREGTKLTEKEYELYDPLLGKRIFVDAKKVSATRYFDTTLKLPRIPELKETKRLVKQGFKRFDELMTPRQRVTISCILTELKKQSKPIQQIVLSAIADCVRTISILAHYSKKYKKIIPGFVIKSYWIPKEPAELNPLSHKLSKSGPPIPIGRGNLFSFIRKLYRAKIWGAKQGYFKQKPKILVGDAEDIIPSIKNNIDAVITDPPYFDTQTYQDLSAFSLAILYSWKAIPEKKETFRYDDIINTISKKDLNPNNVHINYFSKLENIFKKIKEKLTPNAPIIFSFHHRDPNIEFKVWKTIEKIFSPIAIYVVPGESSGKLGRGVKKTDFLFYFANKKEENIKNIKIFWMLSESEICKCELIKIYNFINMVAMNYHVNIIKEIK